MTSVTHLKSLQALELAVREGSLKAAAERLAITPAAVGQRIRTLETYLGTDLLMRGRSGLVATPQLERALADLRSGFAALDRVSEMLDFQRVAEIHVVADLDWAELWLQPRLPAFREAHPNVLFCINGAGDVPLRLGAPDIRIGTELEDGEVLFRDLFLPVSGPDNTRRIAGYDPEMSMEGMPLLHLQGQHVPEGPPGWPDWFERYGMRRDGPARGVRYRNTVDGLAATRDEVGFLLCGLALTLGDLDAGTLVLPFPAAQHVPARAPYRLKIANAASLRPQTARFVDWLRAEAAETGRRLQEIAAG